MLLLQDWKILTVDVKLCGCQRLVRPRRRLPASRRPDVAVARMQHVVTVVIVMTRVMRVDAVEQYVA